jgi:hypothetical protein
MCELEEMFDRPLTEIFKEPRSSHMRALLYVGLKCAGDKRVTIEEAGKLISDHYFTVRKDPQLMFDKILAAMAKGGFADKPKEASEDQEGNPPDQEDATPQE